MGCRSCLDTGAWSRGNIGGKRVPSCWGRVDMQRSGYIRSGIHKSNVGEEGKEQTRARSSYMKWSSILNACASDIQERNRSMYVRRRP